MCIAQMKKKKKKMQIRLDFQWNLASQHLGTNADQMVVNTESIHSLYKNTIRTCRSPRLASPVISHSQFDHAGVLIFVSAQPETQHF